MFPDSNRNFPKKDLILNTTSQLHHLRSLRIFASVNRIYRCTHVTRRYDVHKAILRALDKFEKLDGDDGVTGLVGYDLHVEEKRFFVPRAFGL
jgi:hypothetical protein